jgi:hypothetical protein
MPDDRENSGRTGILRGVASLGGRAVTATMRPVSDEIEQALIAVAGNPRIHALIRRALYSDTARDLVDDFFASGLFDRFVDRLLASDGLWRIVDEVAESPSVTAAISGQGLGFADQLGGELRTRSRRVDQWPERRLRRRTSDAPSDPGTVDGDRDAS